MQKVVEFQEGLNLLESFGYKMGLALVLVGDSKGKFYLAKVFEFIIVFWIQFIVCFQSKRKDITLLPIKNFIFNKLLNLSVMKITRLNSLQKYNFNSFRA